MIAAARRRISKTARRRIDLALWWATKQTRRADRALNRRIERAHPALLREARRAGKAWKRWSARVGRRLRPVAARFFKGLAAGEHALRGASAAVARAATRASAVVTPERALGAVILAAATCLLASQFVDYRAIEIGQPGYAGLPTIATPPTVGVKTAGEAHSYVLIPLALAAAMLGVAAVSRRRRRLARVVFALGLAAIAVILLVDLPSGLDAGAETSRFAGAAAVLYDGFYAELAAAAAIALSGLALSFSHRSARLRARRPKRSRRSKNTQRAVNRPQTKPRPSRPVESRP